MANLIPHKLKQPVADFMVSLHPHGSDSQQENPGQKYMRQ